jgi:hypothetical protein
VTVHRLNGDGSIGEQVAQTASWISASMPIRCVSPRRQDLILCSRGNDARTASRKTPAISKCSLQERPACQSADHQAGASGLGIWAAAPGFRSQRRFAYVSLDGKTVSRFRLEADGTLTQEPLF